MRSCNPTCAGTVASNFTVQLTGAPQAAPAGVTYQVVNDTNRNRLNCTWTSVAGADFYPAHLVQPGAGPGGGALTVAGTQTGTNSVSMLIPNGNAFAFVVRGCNGDGCGPFSGALPISAGFGSPAAPILAEPFPGSVISAGTQAPVATFTWNRVAGDNGSNYKYRLYVQDFSRNTAAVDVLTSNNYHAAYVNPFTRYDALVIAIPNSGASTVQGPPSGFRVRFEVQGKVPNAPSFVSPTGFLTVSAGIVRLGWTPMVATSGAIVGRVYQYTLAGPSGYLGGLVQGTFDNRNLTPGVYNGTVRGCTTGTDCKDNLPGGWGPWAGSQTGEGGPIQFTVQ